MTECRLCGDDVPDGEGCRNCAESREQWADYLDAFRETMYPVMQPFGLSFGEAFIAWQLNRVRNAVPSLGPDEPDEPWKTS